MNRYSRQQDLLGEEGQHRLSEARVLVIGSGGLGSPALYALAAAGVGTIGIIDDDRVEIHNLNRQILHSTLGSEKSSSAADRLRALNPDLEIQSYQKRFNQSNGPDLADKYDLIVDCVDNFETRSLVSSMAMKKAKTVIEGGIEGYQGFVQIIRPGETACFNCLSTGQGEIYRQVLGAATGIIGNLMALEAIKQLTGKWDGSYSFLSLELDPLDTERLLLKPEKECKCNGI